MLVMLVMFVIVMFVFFYDVCAVSPRTASERGRVEWKIEMKVSNI